MATNYDINYNDDRFKAVKSEQTNAINEIDETYGKMIGNTDKFYQDQIAESERWKNEQTKLQNEQTAFTVEKIEQQKDQAEKDYIKEQSGAYVDWQKQSNQYGANAEQMAAQGMQNTGFSESSQVSMYNTYQNRVATAREVYNRAVLNYDNSIKEAQLQNSSILAEIAHNAFVQQAQLALEGFQYKNSLITEQADRKMEAKRFYADEYQRVLDQMNTDRAFAEEVRQYNQNYNLQVKEYEEGIRQFNEEIARLKAKDAKEYALEIQQLELQKAQLEEEKRQFNKLHSSSSGSISKSSGGSSSSGSSGKKSSSSSSKKSAFSNVKYSGKVNSTKSTTSSSNNSVDMKSVLALGYGPISAKRAYELVQQGIAETYKKNGKTYFRLSASTNKLKRLFNGGKF